MRLLFLHQNFPGQFVHVVNALRRRRDYDLLTIVPETLDRPTIIPTRTYRFSPPSSPGASLAAHYGERAARGAAVALALQSAKRAGFTPDLVVGHPGWGETLFVRDVYPDTKILAHAEFYYSAFGADAGFDAEFHGQTDLNEAMRIRSRNVVMDLAIQDCDHAISPTEWQASRYPQGLQNKISIIHEGIDITAIGPNPRAAVKLARVPNPIKAGDEVVTYVARNLEPHRGFHVFMRALPHILRERPAARAVIVGGNETSYGPPPSSGKTWKQTMLEEVGAHLDLTRVHFVGRVPHATLIRLFQVTAAHVYLTYPFVLSWSMLDAMAAGALVIGSRTPPVTEVLANDRNGLVVDFFNVDEIAAAAIGALKHPGRYTAIREQARSTIVHGFDLRTKCLPEWLALFNCTVAQRTTDAA